MDRLQIKIGDIIRPRKLAVLYMVSKIHGDRFEAYPITNGTNGEPHFFSRFVKTWDYIGHK